MYLAGLGGGLGTDPILGAGQRQEVAELGGVDHHRRAKAGRCAAVQVERDQREDPLRVGLDGDRLAAPEDLQSSARSLWL